MMLKNLLQCDIIHFIFYEKKLHRDNWYHFLHRCYVLKKQYRYGRKKSSRFE